MNISVIGLGKLGCPMAAWFASKGHKVTGVDVNQEYVDAVNAMTPPVEEAGLRELMVSFLGGPRRLTATLSHRQAVLDSDITFIVVPTPSTNTGAFSLKWVKAAAVQIGLALKDKESYHLVVITSTVMPGHSQQILETLEAHSGKKCGEGFGLCYNPEFIALGSVLHDLENPDFVLIGESDQKAGYMLRDFYTSGLFRWVLSEGNKKVVAVYNEPLPHFHRTSFVNAEIAKLALNCFVTTKISFANMIGRLCELYHGADADEVTGAIGLDSRIGRKYLKAGTPFGGPCFPRDNEAFMTVIPRHEITIPIATKAENSKTLVRITNVVRDYSKPGGTVGIIGTAYKPGTALTEESAGIKLMNALAREGRLVQGCNAEDDTLTECIEGSDVVVLMLPYSLDWSWYQLGGKVIVDPWRCINPDTLPLSVTYVPMGRFHVACN